MARQDFAQKRRSSHSASRQPRKHPAPAPRKSGIPWGLGLVTLLAVIGLGYLLVSLVDLQSGPDTTRVPASAPAAPATPAPAAIPEPAMAQPATPLEQTIEAQPEAQPETQLDAEPDPATVTRENRFDFYDILPRSEVQAPEVDVYRSTPRDAEPEHRFLLQAGSFRDADDAERMRAQLILNGFPNVHTSQVSGENGVWYRVRTGPFDDRSSLNRAQDQLVRLRISPMVIRLD